MLHERRGGIFECESKGGPTMNTNTRPESTLERLLNRLTAPWTAPSVDFELEELDHYLLDRDWRLAKTDG